MLAWLPECGWTLACSAPKIFGALDGQALDHVHVLAAAVPAFAGIAFGIFVGQDRALGFHHGGADKVFAGDQLDVFLLALPFQENGVGDFGINRLQSQAIGRGVMEGSILLMRRSWRPPSNCAARKASKIFRASLGGGVLAPRQRTLALLCWRASAAICSSKTSAARTPRDFVGRHAHAHARRANQKAKFAPARRNRFAHRPGVIGIIATSARTGPHVGQGNALGLQ
jgi:hypothetical protein